MTQTAPRLDQRDLRSYWAGLSDRFLDRDAEGLAVICFAGMPPWFNRFMDRYQRLALAKLTEGIDLRGARVLDVGTGVGRWARWYAQRGASVVGIDLEEQRLRVARLHTPFDDVTYDRMSADQLAFGAGSFDLVNSITVLQHVDRATKERAIDEIARVLRAGGRAVLFELVDMTDDAPHVFPESRASWEALCAARGLRTEHVIGEQYTPLLRLAKGVTSRLSRGRHRERIDGFKATSLDRGALHPATVALRALVLASYPVEELWRRFAPPSAAKINGLLLRKDTGARSERAAA